MSRRCRFTRIASSDLENILDYIAEQNGIDVAEKFLKRINQKCQNLVNFPELGKRRDELFPGIRSLPVGKYLIFYRLLDTELEVVRIVSGYQDVEALFKN